MRTRTNRLGSIRQSAAELFTAGVSCRGSAGECTAAAAASLAALEACLGGARCQGRKNQDVGRGGSMGVTRLRKPPCTYQNTHQEWKHTSCVLCMSRRCACWTCKRRTSWSCRCHHCHCCRRRHCREVLSDLHDCLRVCRRSSTP